MAGSPNSPHPPDRQSIYGLRLQRFGLVGDFDIADEIVVALPYRLKRPDVMFVVTLRRVTILIEALERAPALVGVVSVFLELRIPETLSSRRDVPRISRCAPCRGREWQRFSPAKVEQP